MGDLRKCGGWCGRSCGSAAVLGAEWDPLPVYQALLDSGLDDLDVDCLAGAQFLFAVWMVRVRHGEPDYELMLRRYVPFWRERLDREAWLLLAAKIKKWGWKDEKRD